MHNNVSQAKKDFAKNFLYPFKNAWVDADWQTLFKDSLFDSHHTMFWGGSWGYECLFSILYSKDNVHLVKILNFREKINLVNANRTLRNQRWYFKICAKSRNFVKFFRDLYNLSFLKIGYKQFFYIKIEGFKQKIASQKHCKM